MPFTLIVSLFLGAMYLFFLNPVLDLRGFNSHDPAAYLGRAVSLLEGRGYGERFADGFLPVTIQPPAFSWMLAPVVGIFGMNFTALKLFMVGLAVVAAFAFNIFFKNFLAPKEAPLAVLLMMSHPVLFGLSHRVLAEIPLFAVTALALTALDRSLKKTDASVGSLMTAAFFTAAAFLFKSTALGIAAGGWFLSLQPGFRSRSVFFKLFFWSAVTAVLVAPWSLWAKQQPDVWFWTHSSVQDFFHKDPYDPQSAFISLGDWLIRLKHNLAWGLSSNAAAGIVAPLYYLEGGFAGFFLSLPVMATLAWAWIKSFKKEPSVLEGFTFFGLLLLLIKNEGMAARYVAYMYPAFAVYFFRLIRSAKNLSVLPYLLIFMGTASSLVSGIDQMKNPYGTKALADYEAASEAAKAYAPAGSRCLAPSTSHWQALTGHVCFSSPAKALAAVAGSKPGYYVILSSRAGRNMQGLKDANGSVLRSALEVTQAVEAAGLKIEKVYENDTFAVGAAS